MRWEAGLRSKMDGVGDVREARLGSVMTELPGGGSDPLERQVSGPEFRARPATTASIVACTLAFAGCLVALVLRSDDPLRAIRMSSWKIEDLELLTDAGALAATSVWIDQQWWRVASAGVLHGSLLHLGLNMLGLWTVGQWTEKVWGGWRQLALLGISSIGGCLASLAWAEAPMVVGASAGIFGVAGALVVARAWGSAETRDVLAPVSARSLGFWLVFWLAVGALIPLIFGISILAQAGHLGGLGFGCLLGYGMSRPREQRWARVGSWVAVVLGLCGMVAAARAPSWRPNYPVFMAVELLSRADYPGAVEQFDAALVRAPDDHELANAAAYWLAEAGVELDRAELYVGQALAVEPGNADYLDTLGWIWCKQGRGEAGVVVLRMAGPLAERETPEIAEHVEQCAAVGVPRGTP